MGTHFEKLVEKYGQERASEIMSERARKSWANRTGKHRGGFNVLAETDPKRFKEISAKGGRGG
jgi:hypothetical protein